MSIENKIVAEIHKLCNCISGSFSNTTNFKYKTVLCWYGLGPYPGPGIFNRIFVKNLVTGEVSFSDVDIITGDPLEVEGGYIVGIPPCGGGGV